MAVNKGSSILVRIVMILFLVGAVMVSAEIKSAEIDDEVARLDKIVEKAKSDAACVKHCHRAHVFNNKEALLAAFTKVAGTECPEYNNQFSPDHDCRHSGITGFSCCCCWHKNHVNNVVVIMGK